MLSTPALGAGIGGGRFTGWAPGFPEVLLGSGISIAAGAPFLISGLRMVKGADDKLTINDQEVVDRKQESAFQPVGAGKLPASVEGKPVAEPAPEEPAVDLLAGRCSEKEIEEMRAAKMSESAIKAACLSP